MQYREVDRSGVSRRSMRHSHIVRFIGKMRSLVEGASSFLNSRVFVSSTIVGAASVLQLKDDIASREVNLSRNGIQAIYRRYGAPALRSDELMSLSDANPTQEFLEVGDV
ncbi:hypothetical protein [Bradyrhizobium jicamae]|nr:hypothetical protein [Bradyrhizobium jicamae]